MNLTREPKLQMMDGETGCLRMMIVRSQVELAGGVRKRSLGGWGELRSCVWKKIPALSIANRRQPSNSSCFPQGLKLSGYVNTQRTRNDQFVLARATRSRKVTVTTPCPSLFWSPRFFPASMTEIVHEGSPRSDAYCMEIVDIVGTSIWVTDRSSFLAVSGIT